MKNKYVSSILSLSLCAAIAGCTTTPEKTVEQAPAEANAFGQRLSHKRSR